MYTNFWSSSQSAVGRRQSALTIDNRSACGGTTRNRRGFTLVELLVVIVIIIILMGLLTPVLINALARAREGRIIAEIGQLDSAMKAYKERFGSYPPSDFSNVMSPTGPVAIHIQRAFPRCSVANELAAINSVGGTSLTPAQALCFWLSGFTSDPERPISGKLPPARRRRPHRPPESPPRQRRRGQADRPAWGRTAVRARAHSAG